ncbi:MAG: phosphate acyltransferase PlsX [Candidatus Omnitrophota bacterium]
MTISVDAMGGDYAPGAVVQGAVDAAREYGLGLILVGDQARIRRELDKHNLAGIAARITIFPADETIAMDEPGAVSARRKRGSSIVKGIDLVKQGRADAFVSAGNTGAVVCAASLCLRMLSGIERPGISINIPTLKGVSLLVDVGANIDPKPVHLLHYAVMGNAYCRYVLKMDNPRIGLLNVGEEDGKGTDFIRRAFALLEAGGFNFIGNVEGRDLFSGACDIIVCDGWSGNIALKVSEGLMDSVGKLLRRELMGSLAAKMGLLLLKGKLRKIKNTLDYSEYGGAPLLGINGVVIIGHGSSNSRAIKNAIRVAGEEIGAGVNKRIIEAVSDISEVGQ